MCDSCGCGTNEKHAHHHHLHSHTERKGHAGEKILIDVREKILAENDRRAADVRQRLEGLGLFSINLMGAPGCGKTTLLEKTIEYLGASLKIGVLEGDLETDLDAQRIRAKGVPAYQITTGRACHLDAAMILRGLENLPAQGLDLLFVENVGNLVCPASYDLGTHVNAALLSIPEGHDKPAKYPVMFRAVEVLIITKTDLTGVCDFDIEKARQAALKVNPRMTIIELSSRTGEGFDRWLEYIARGRAEFLRKPSKQSPEKSPSALERP